MDVYEKLGCTRDDFCTMFLQEIEDGITSEKRFGVDV